MRLVWQEAKLVGGRMVLVVPLGWELVFATAAGGWLRKVQHEVVESGS